MNIEALMEEFHRIASDPSGQMNRYLSQGEKVILCAPVYTPEEIVHAMGLVPMGAWGADTELAESKRFFPGFICSIVQSIVELGIRGSYEGASAIIIPSLCDSLKVLGENWKYAVPSIPMIPMSWPQNRKPQYARDYTLAGYRRVISDLEKCTGAVFSEEALADSVRIYNEHNQAMHRLAELMAGHGEISAGMRSDIFKSAFFIRKEEHTALVKELIRQLENAGTQCGKTRIYISGILCDSPALLEILDENGFRIVGDDLAAQSRQYRTDCPAGEHPLKDLAEKFSLMDSCSVLYSEKKERIGRIVQDAQSCGAQGVLMVQTQFCDPEEFDYPLIRKACEAAGIPCIQIVTDRQMKSFEQARTALETFRDLLS